MGFKSTIIALLLVGIFAFAMISFNVELVTQNGGNISLLNNPTINTTYQELKGNLSTTRDDFQTQSDIIAGTEPEGTFTILQSSLSGAWTVFIKAPQAIFTSVFSLVNIELFGGSENFGVVLGVISTIIVFVIILYVIKLVRIGDPD